MLLIIGFALLGAVIQEIGANDCPKPFNEAPCLSFGGICVAVEDCPVGRLEPTSGLCPLQQDQGVECCYGIPKSEKRCRNNGGECVPRTNRCPENLTFKEASDCKADQKCCTLVQ